MKNNKLVFSLLFVLVSLLSYSQDMILKRDSSVIFCHIIKEDSATIYYRQKQGEQTMELNVKKADVLGYYSKKAQMLADLKRADSLAKVNAKRDTVWVTKNTLNSKTDSIRTQVVSIPTKKDTLQTKVVASQLKKDTVKELQNDSIICLLTKTGHVIDRSEYQKDTILLNINYKCFYKGELITKKEALALMTGYGSRKEMKLARSYYAPVIPLGVGAVVCAGVFIYDAVSDGNFHWVVGGSSIIAAVLAITWKHYSNIHLYKAVRLYNANRDIAVAYIPKFELGVASKDIGLCLKF